MKIEQGIQSEKTASVAGEEGNVRFCLSWLKNRKKDNLAGIVVQREW